MAKNHQLTHRVIPTVVAVDEAGKVLIGDDAKKKASIGGRSNIRCFKQDLGKPPGQSRSIKSFWTSRSGSGGSEDVSTYTAYEAAELYLATLLSEIDRPAQLIVGIPSSAEETWMEHYKHNVSEILVSMGFEPPRWLYEPFAVYQYYRANHNVQFDEQQTILVVDIGGSTFSTCVIHTAKSGAIAKSGVHSVPIGLQSTSTGGNYVDISLLHALTKKTSLNWKEPIDNRLQLKQCAAVLPRIEEVKIALSNVSPGRNSNNQNGETGSQKLSFETGTMHPDEPFSCVATVDDLNDVIDGIWVNDWAPQVIKTLKSAEKVLGVPNLSLDAAIVAGGSAQLPQTRDQLYRAIKAFVKDQKSIIALSDPGYAVAEGIAIEAREESKRYSNLKSHTLGPCLIGDLYIGVKKDRLAHFSPLHLSSGQRVNHQGRLFTRPFEMDSSEISYDVQLPIDITNKIYVGFFAKPIGSEANEPLNLADQGINIPNNNGKINRKATLKLRIGDDQFISGALTIKSKNHSASGGEIELHTDDFRYSDLECVEGEVYFGLDFGNSNSYVTRILEANEVNEPHEIPTYRTSRAAEQQARRIRKRIEALQTSNRELYKSFVEHAKDLVPDTVFHSSKLERLDVELDRDDSGSVRVSSSVENDDNEAAALRDAYDWMLENIELFGDSPEAFVCRLHSILCASEGHAGQYRKTDKKPSRSNFKYVPPAFVVPRIRALFGCIGQSLVNEDPLFLASWTHAAFESIHPFEDGNGRVGRLLAAAILLKNGYPSLLLRVDSRDRYLDALERSNSGDVSNLIHVFSDAVKNLLDDCERQSSLADSVEIEVGNVSAIQEALSSEDPLDAVLDLFNSSSDTHLRSLYDGWAAEIDRLYRAISDQLQVVREKSPRLDVSAHYFSTLTFETFEDACRFQKFITAWWFKIDLKFMGKKESILFEFVPDEDHQYVGSKVSVRRLVNGEYMGLTDEPISAREIRYSRSGKLVSVRETSSAELQNIDLFCRRFVAEVIAMGFL